MLLCAKPCKYVQSQSRYLLLSGKHEAAPPHFWQPDSLTKLLHSLETWWLAPATQKLRPCISQLAAAERKAGNQQICFNQAFGQISQNSVRCENKGHGREREWFWFLTLFEFSFLFRCFSIIMTLTLWDWLSWIPWVYAAFESLSGVSWLREFGLCSLLNQQSDLKCSEPLIPSVHCGP